jgi:hypothetical protein
VHQYLLNTHTHTQSGGTVHQYLLNTHTHNQAVLCTDNFLPLPPPYTYTHTQTPNTHGCTLPCFALIPTYPQTGLSAVHATTGYAHTGVYSTPYCVPIPAYPYSETAQYLCTNTCFTPPPPPSRTQVKSSVPLRAPIPAHSYTKWIVRSLIW